MLPVQQLGVAVTTEAGQRESVDLDHFARPSHLFSVTKNYGTREVTCILERAQ